MYQEYNKIFLLKNYEQMFAITLVPPSFYLSFFKN